MNAKKEICIGMAGAGRATELHMNALNRYSGVPICYKHIIAHRFEQVNQVRNVLVFIMPVWILMICSRMMRLM